MTCTSVTRIQVVIPLKSDGSVGKVRRSVDARQLFPTLVAHLLNGTRELHNLTGCGGLEAGFRAITLDFHLLVDQIF